MPVAQQLIDFDREWSALMARKPEEISDPQELARYYLGTAEFPSGFMTRYGASMIVADRSGTTVCEGFPVGKRFRSAPVSRVCDGNVVHLGHHARADGRWRVYVFADAQPPGAGSAVADWAAWAASPGSPLSRFTPPDADVDAVFDVKVIYQQRHEDVDVALVPDLFRPATGPLGLTDWEKVYAAGPSAWNDVDVFAERGVDRDGAVVLVRPDQYVAAVLPLPATDELTRFLDGVMIDRSTGHDPRTA